MPITTITCYRLDCDACGKPVLTDDGEGGGFPPHFTTPEEAVADLYGDPDLENGNPDARLLPEGQGLDDGTILCGPCNTTRLCAERGHRFTGWGTSWGCDCSPWDCTHEERRCRRNWCKEREERPAAVVAA